MAFVQESFHKVISQPECLLAKDQKGYLSSCLETKLERNKLQLEIKKPPSADIEGYYFKCLMQAKEQNLVEEQILYLLKLNALYIEKAEQTFEKKNLDKEEQDAEKKKKENFYLVFSFIL